VERLYLNALDRTATRGDRPLDPAPWTPARSRGPTWWRGFAFSDEMTVKLTPLAADGAAFV
jgi:hypothetical protein